MDKAEIKRQISYWEAILKDNEKQVKNLEETNKSIKATLKFLKSQLPQQALDEPVLEEPQP